MSQITYANLTIDGQALLLPQSELIHLESISNIKPRPDGAVDSTVGFINYDNGCQPVYVINSYFSLLETIPEQRQFVACMDSGDNQLCITCDEATTIRNESEYTFEDMPELCAP